MARKAEFPALLPGGFHSLTIAQIRERCVTAFPLSKTREGIMASLETAVERIRAAGVPCELWIDGSFLTEKIDPSDVDLALIIPSHMQTAASATLRKTLEWIESDETREREGIDGYVLTKFQESSPMIDKWRAERDKFTKLFGTKYDDVTPKGVALMLFRGGA